MMTVKKAKEEIDAADLCDDRKLRVIQAIKRVREDWERQEREKMESERLIKIWLQQQEQRKTERWQAAEAMRKQQAEWRAAEEKGRGQEAAEDY